ncbi:MAG: Ig-like domain repeat protein [Terracidiphilus sp.]
MTKLNPTASQLVYSTYLGGERQDSVQAISLDAPGDAYVTGFANSQDFPTTSGVFQPTMTVIEGPGSQNAFVTKFDSSGTGLVYSSFLGGTKNVTGGVAADIGRGIAVDSSGDAYVAGSTPDPDFPVTPGALQSQNTAQLISDDGASFLSKVNPTASQIIYSTYLSGSGDGSGETCDCANGIALDSAGNAYLAGEVSSTDFPTTEGSLQPQSGFQGWEWTTFVTEFNASEMTTLPATTTLVSSNANPQVFGKPVTFTATVQPSGGSTPTGTVGFSMTTTSLGLFPTEMSGWTTVSVNGSGVATYTTIPTVSGPVTVNATYLGDANNAPSSETTTQTVTQIPTVTTLTSSANPAAYGQPVTYTVTVKETATGNPATGYIQGTFGESNLNSAGQVIWSTNGTGLPVGTNTVKASFYPAEPALIDQPSSATLVRRLKSS